MGCGCGVLVGAVRGYLGVVDKGLTARVKETVEFIMVLL